MPPAAHLFSLLRAQHGVCVESQALIGRSEAEGREMQHLERIRRATLKNAKSGNREGAGRGAAGRGRERAEG